MNAILQDKARLVRYITGIPTIVTISLYPEKIEFVRFNTSDILYSVPFSDVRDVKYASLRNEVILNTNEKTFRISFYTFIAGYRSGGLAQVLFRKKTRDWAEAISRAREKSASKTA